VWVPDRAGAQVPHGIATIRLTAPRTTSTYLSPTRTKRTTQLSPKVGFYNIWYWSPSEDGDVTRSGNVIHETGADAKDNI
jgi:hypothetical protein